MAILLIGSAGNGKSTLGNFLLDPDKTEPGGTFFKVATGNRPKTQITQIESLDVSKTMSTTLYQTDQSLSFGKLTVIDTPGLNESKVHDLRHMINLIDKLSEVGEIKVCIFVVKFSNKIDQQYKDTIEYYSRLLPSLFQKNVIIVVTDYLTDERSQKLRKKQGINDEDITDAIITEVVQSANMSYTPMLVTIDCLPLDKEDLDESKGKRESIISYVHSMEAVKVKNLQVAKTSALLEDDKKLECGYAGEINAYSQRLKEVNDIATAVALDATQEKEEEITKLDKAYVILQESLDEKCSDLEVISGNVSVDDTWRFFRTLSKKVEIESKWDISSTTKWTNGRCEWAEYKQETRSVQAVLKGKFMRGLYANISTFTTKRLKFAEEIKELNYQVHENRTRRENAEKTAADSRKKHEEYSDEMEKLKLFIEAKREAIKLVSCKTMTIEQALVRLDKLCSSSSV